ncbi:MAG: methyltransferase, partial [Gluconacetobacter sp.]
GGATPRRGPRPRGGVGCKQTPPPPLIRPGRRGGAPTAEVWIADPGRAYLPRAGLHPIITRDIPTTRELEDRDTRRTTLYRITP